MESKPGRRTARRWLLVPALAVFLGSVLWLRGRPVEDAAREAHESPTNRMSAGTGEVLEPQVDVARRVSRPGTPPIHAHTEAGAVPNDEGVEPVEPHPIDSEREALLPPWATFEEVWGALERREFERARTLLERRQAEDPRRDEWRDFYLGLDIVRECMQAPGAGSRVRAKRFMADDEFRASPLRRHVRRNCIAAESAAGRGKGLELRGNFMAR
jgi:hypothetical protein